jgi:ABC-type sugar transport system ATPase subunit
MRASSASTSATTRGDGVAPSPRAPAVAISGLRKRYGGVVALDGADLTVERGTIHAVVGENGAGKSTLMKILAGAVRRDGGDLAVDGDPVQAASTKDARQRGIGIVHQELALFPTRPVLAGTSGSTSTWTPR